LLYHLKLADFQERVRDELTRILSAGGFDAGHDVAAITVNRWGHGYAYSGDPVFDPQDDARRPWETVRVRVGQDRVRECRRRLGAVRARGDRGGSPGRFGAPQVSFQPSRW
jgi:hypothetical protein